MKETLNSQYIPPFANEKPVDSEANLCSHMFRINELICNINATVNRIAEVLIGEKDEEESIDGCVGFIIADAEKDAKNLDKIMQKLDKIATKIG